MNEGNRPKGVIHDLKRIVQEAEKADGRSVSDERSVFLRRWMIRVAVISLAILLVAACVAAFFLLRSATDVSAVAPPQAPAANRRTPDAASSAAETVRPARKPPGRPVGTILREERFGAYRLVVRARGEFAGCRDAESFEILRDGRLVFASNETKTDACYFHPGETDGSEEWAEANAGIWPPMGKDITGDGRPNLVVRGYPLGRVESSLFVFDISETFWPVLTLDRVDCCTPVFKDRDGDGYPEIHAEDAVYEDIPRALAAMDESHRPVLNPICPSVVLKYRRDRYEPAPKLMRGVWFDPAKFDEELKWNRARLARDVRDGDAAAWLIQRVLLAIYSGHAAKGWRMFDLAWPDSDAKKPEVRRMLTDGLRRSPYWTALEEVNAPEPVLPPEGT